MKNYHEEHKVNEVKRVQKKLLEKPQAVVTESGTRRTMDETSS